MNQFKIDFLTVEPTTNCYELIAGMNDFEYELVSAYYNKEDVDCSYYYHIDYTDEVNKFLSDVFCI